MRTPAAAVELTTVWGVNAGYEHFWTKRWQTSLYGTYIKTKYNSHGERITSAQLSLFALAIGCNNNWHYWNVGSRTQFNVDSQTYIGLDVIYTALDTANASVPVHSPDRAAAGNGSHYLRSERVDGGVPLPSQLLSLIV